MTLADFRPLYATFRADLARIAAASARGPNPWLDIAVARFRREVEGPMDRSWSALSDIDKQAFLKEGA